jgi:ParB family chromosome partitioning protein
MSKNKLALGRGLASLIPQPGPSATQRIAPPPDDGTSNEIIVRVPLDKIERNPYQPRAEFDPVALDELKRSIKEKGIIQPITVRRIAGGYQLISGERRVRAARAAGLTEVPAYVISVRSDEEMLELALIENLQRSQLNPIEVAISYKRLIEECNLTQDEVSQRMSKDRSTVTNFLRLLKLPDVIQVAVRRGELSGGHARALLGFESEERQLALFHKVLKRGLSVREVERLVQAQAAKRDAKGRRAAGTSSATYSSIEEQIRRLLGTRIHVRRLQGGKGEIVIEFYSADDLERLLEIFDTMQGTTR